MNSIVCGQANELGIAMLGQNQCILERLLDVLKYIFIESSLRLLLIIAFKLETKLFLLFSNPITLIRSFQVRIKVVL